jgi:eukaryotic-like serine/threonine-protein kinase
MSHTVSYFYRFGEFAVDLEQRVLMRGSNRVPLTPKVFDTLLILVEQHGRIVSKDELMNRLWPDAFVEESNLIFNVQHLRKALADNARQPVYVETVARRGYRFIADVEECVIDVPVVPATRDESSQADQPRNPSRFATSSFVVIGIAVSVVFVGLLATWYFAQAKGNLNNFAVSSTRASAAPALKIEKITDTGKNRHAVISPDGQYVAYTFEVKGRHGIWLRQIATDTAKEILAPSERLGGLGFSHDGKYLYFIKGPVEWWALYRVPLPLGGVPVRLIEKLQASYSISPDDRTIAFVRYSDDDKQCALMLADADGQNERQIAIHNQPDRFNTPAWSPDGTKLVVAVGPSDSGTQQVRIVEFNINTGLERELPTGRWFHISRITWLPDQNSLIVVGNRTLGQNKQIWKVNYATGQATAVTDEVTSYVDVSLTADGNRAVAPEARFTSNIWIGSATPPQTLKQITHAVEDFCWTPDGRIIYASHTSINPNLWIMAPDGTEQKQLTYAGDSNSSPSITPDGRHIVFSSNRAGVHHIWRMDLDGGNAIQLTTGTGKNFPTVSPDGRWVFYNNVDDWSVWKISIDGGEPVRLTNDYSLYPSISPDGKLIACVGKTNDQRRQLLILSSADGRILQKLDLDSMRLLSYRLRWSGDGKSIMFAASGAGAAGIFTQKLAGGAAERVVTFDQNDIYDFGFSPDGKQLAVTRGEYQFDVVLLSGLNQ